MRNKDPLNHTFFPGIVMNMISLGVQNPFAFTEKKLTLLNNRSCLKLECRDLHYGKTFHSGPTGKIAELLVWQSHVAGDAIFITDERHQDLAQNFLKVQGAFGSEILVRSSTPFTFYLEV